MSIQEMLLTPNNYSRPGTNIKAVRGVVIHWVANPGASAQANRDFFENRKLGGTGYGSAHYIVGLDGEVIRCLPESEMAYHVGSETYTKEALSQLSSYPNDCTIGIECCHIDWDGRMTDATYAALVELATDLLRRHNLNESQLWLHKEVVGWKDCHRWFVNNPDEWVKFKGIVSNKLKGGDDEVSKPTLDPGVATTIINTWISPAWHSTTDQQQKDYLHWLANQLREASGQPVQD